MALRFMDGFELFTTRADLAAKYNNIAASDSNVLFATGRRGDGQSLKLYSGSGFVQKTLDDQDTWTVGFGLYFEALPTSGSGLVFFYDNTVNNQLTLAIDTAGQITMRRGSGTGTILCTSSISLSVAVWYFVEAKIFISDTVGTVEIRVNGETVATFSGDTKMTTLATANIIRLQGVSLGPIRIDDFYVCDGTGSANNSFLGDCRVDTLFPTGAGHTGFTPIGGVNNWENVASALPLDETNYNSATLSETLDTFACADLSTLSSTIFGVQENISARKDDAGVREAASVARVGGTDYPGATHSLADSYLIYRQIWETNPNTAAAWTESEVNASQFGYKVV